MNSMTFGNITHNVPNPSWQDGYEKGAKAEAAHSTQKALRWATAGFFTALLMALLIATVAMVLS